MMMLTKGLCPRSSNHTPQRIIMDGHHNHLGHLVGLGGHLSWSKPISMSSIYVTGEKTRINYYIFSFITIEK